MQTKDVTSKNLLKRMAADLANVLLHLDIDPDSVELLETQRQRVEERRADLVIRTVRRGETQQQILHIEIQGQNQADMPVRMMRYYTDIRLDYPLEPVRQHLIYIGKSGLAMPDRVEEDGWAYRYHILDMRTVDCGVLLAQDTPEALVMAILCDFRGQPAGEVVKLIASRLRMLFRDDEQGFSNHFAMLEILAQNRDLEQEIQETKEMLTQIDVTRFASYQWGWEAAMEKMQEALQQKERQVREALQQKERQEKQLKSAAAHLLAMKTLDNQAIADLLGLPLETVAEIARQGDSTQH